MIAYDHRNHGESGSSDNGACIASLAADLHELLEQLGIEQANLLGNSMGCSVLWSYVDLYGTDRVSSLVLVDQPSVCALVPWLTQADAAQVGAIMDFAGASSFVQGLLGESSDAVRRDFLRSMLKPDISAEDFDWLLGQNMTMRMPFGARLVLDHVLQDWRSVLPRIDVPALVTGGEQSHVDATSQRWIAEQIPGAKLHVFSPTEGGDHFPFLGPQGLRRCTHRVSRLDRLRRARRSAGGVGVATGLLDHAMGDQPEVQVESCVAVVDVESGDFANPVEPVVEGGSGGCASSRRWRPPPQRR